MVIVFLLIVSPYSWDETSLALLYEPLDLPAPCPHPLFASRSPRFPQKHSNGVFVTVSASSAYQKARLDFS
ncbi:hypothetical protein B0H63DRAFT_463486 [Podospora didyma]|uniref:Uncharacterized protein n=1 Tax=Podospora didyma TaxID=330526 RepID=A0AAE0NXQ6_9PEZI|nr:hypothetical protein B0H63DRAFT_463486 [Podospora didyma]